ncbi:Acetyltransferase (GNAT) domain-containing protein [Ruminococcus flavefaciens]|uniref:Acetyltransferase (GNAT) domain-containing protein n=1 Tax=Ruminococcus flavefaciens TaxID=1265 RepID=A0A1H6IW75_RUMFL|nr:GNAT family N-acetyltransferase [Ruminococcus flavefaciens]SEH51280.1 Acetyltransferase (GNAT) domain-containing protein [Ruminococcus flavefaciens]
MVTISKVNKDTELAKQLLQFVEDCSWHEVKEHIADMLRSWEFTEWECMFAALDDGDIVGMASIMKTDYYPLPDIYPWISCIFVTESARGQRISGQLIEYANIYANELGFKRTYIPTEYTGLYEHYGYRYVRDIVNYGGGTDRLYVKETE